MSRFGHDYSDLLSGESAILPTWESVYNPDLELPQNFLNLLQKSVLLPYDYYDIIASYALIPSALAKVVPYLFFYGNSGSGKSTVGKLISYLHGVDINSSSDTFASIRNTLNERKYGTIEVIPINSETPPYFKDVELNTIMVWDDIDSQLFTSDTKLYRMIKFGYDRQTDKITISSDKPGENLVFHCFCPKVFSSISPLHLSEALKELKRRMIVVPTVGIESLSDERLTELGVTPNDWQEKLIDIDLYEWEGFSKLFKQFWDRDMAQIYLVTKNSIARRLKGLSSKQKTLCLDLITTGIVTGIWNDENQAVNSLRKYFEWYERETSEFSGLRIYLEKYISQQEGNCKAANMPLEIFSIDLMRQVDMWLTQGWVLEKPRPKEVKELMREFGYGLKQGVWVKRI